jgi:uracil-DNA glycosylase
VDPRALSEHLRFYQELGVTGISRDPAWRRRAGAATGGLRLQPSLDDARDGPEPVEGPEITGTVNEASNTDHQSAQPEAPHLADEPPSQPESLPALAGRNAPDITPMQLIRSPEALAAVRHELGECTRCKLHGQGRKQIVFGVGNPAADIMFVGEAPGADEDAQGIPFVGRAGQLLTKMIEAMGLRRDDVYIANVLKCRPPGNRDPEPDEIASCEPFLFQQIASVQPKVIIALGAFAARALLKTQDPISRMRGRVYDYRGAQLIPTFHPSFLLRSPGYKREAWEDLKKALGLLGRQPPGA